MGQAHRAPKQHYGRKFQISAHAIERFRERVDEEFAHRPDPDLMNLLDERICNAKRSEDVIDHHYRDTPSKVYVIESRKGQLALAIVRENTCVTVLDEDMLEANVAKGSWSRRPINTPFAEALAGVKAPRLSTPAGEVSSHQRAVPPKLELPPSDPIAEAGMAHAHALYLEHAAAARIVELERELGTAQDHYETMKNNRARAEAALTAAVLAKTTVTATKEK